MGAACRRERRHVAYHVCRCRGGTHALRHAQAWRRVKQIDLHPLLHYGLIAVAALLTMGVIVKLNTARPCAACTAQSPLPRCAASLSELSLNPEQKPAVWWQRLMPRAADTLDLFLGVDHQGAAPAEVTYRIAVDDP